MSRVIGRVREVWRYPVSTLGGEQLTAADIGASGVDGDRLFVVTRLEDGAVADPLHKAWQPLVRIRSRLAPDGRLQVALPSGVWLDAPGKDADKAVSHHLGFAASISAVTGGAAQPRYHRAPLHLLTTTSLDRLKQLHPEGDPDRRRFRPNILVESLEDEAGFAETGWIGRRMSIGSLELTVTEPTKRCGFTMHAQDGFDYDPEILRSLVRNNRSNLGVYCAVDRPARIEVGAPVRLFD